MPDSVKKYEHEKKMNNFGPVKKLARKSTEKLIVSPRLTSSAIPVSKCTVYPDKISEFKTLKLSASDISMLNCEYYQKGILLPSPKKSFAELLISLKKALATTLSHFYPLAGRLVTASDGQIYITCNDAGVEFLAVDYDNLHIDTILRSGDVPNCIYELFLFNKLLNYSGHSAPLLGVQVTKLVDGVFLGFSVNHAVVDGTSAFHFCRAFAEINRGVSISEPPEFSRDTVFNSDAVIKFPPGGPSVMSGEQPLRRRIFHFSRDSILEVKRRANSEYTPKIDVTETRRCDYSNINNDEISSFQSLCTQLWRSVARARQQATTIKIAANCRNRLDPKLDSHYFGNAIQSIWICAPAGELLTNNLSWGAKLIHEAVVAHDNNAVRRKIAEWERHPKLFRVSKSDGSAITIGGSPRFPYYEIDFGWGKPLAIRTGWNLKHDGEVMAFASMDGEGTVELDVTLAPDTMARLERDAEFMQYVSTEKKQEVMAG